MVFSTFVVAAHLLLQSSAFQLSIPGLAKAPEPDAVLVKINGVPIKAKDVEDLLWDVHGEEILGELADYQVAKSEADKRGILVTQGEVDKASAEAIEQIKKNLAPGQTLEASLAQLGLTKNRLDLRMRWNLYIEKIALQNFDAKEYVRVSTIVVKPRSNSASDVANTIQVVQKAYDRLQAGEPWPKLVDELVTDQYGKETRGLLGWRKLALFPEDVQNEIKALKKGGITKPTQTQFGIQIFRIEEKGSEASKADVDQMKEEVKGGLIADTQRQIRETLKIERVYKPQKSGS